MASRLRCVFLILLLGLLSPGCAKSPAVTEIDDPPGSFEAIEGTSAPPFLSADVVIAIDQSSLALLASGIDVNKDGVVGHNLRPAKEWAPIPTPARSWTTDSNDTVEALQLEVARALIPRLADRGNRVGLATLTLRARTYGTSPIRFYDTSETVVPVGPPDAVLKALEDFPPVRERRHTDLARLLELAAELLDQVRPVEPTRRRTILLLSPGGPSAPYGIYWSSRQAIAAAHQLAERGITVWAIPLGLTDVAYLKELTLSTGGGVLALDQLDSMFGIPDAEAASREQGP